MSWRRFRALALLALCVGCRPKGEAVPQSAELPELPVEDAPVRVQRQGLNADPAEPSESGKYHLFDKQDSALPLTKAKRLKPTRRLLKVDAGFGATVKINRSGLTAAGITTLNDALLPCERKTYNIRNFVQAETECAIYRIGGQDVSMCDVAPAFGRIEDDIILSFDPIEFDWLGYGDRTGAPVYIPPGTWRISQEVRLCRQMLITGAGGGNGGATMIYAPHSVSGIRFAYYDECVAAGVGEGAGGSTMEQLNLYELPGPIATTVPSFGVSIEDAFVTVRHVQTYGFVNAFRISADHTRLPKTNANGFELQHISIKASEHAGVLADGGDANAGLGTTVNVSTGCTRGSYWQSTLGDCADIVESSFLGNTWVAAQASGSVDATTGVNFPNISTDGLSQRASFLGLYSEVDLMPPSFANQTSVLGGTAKDGIGGHREQGDWTSSVIYENAGDPANIVTTRFGAAAAPAAAFEVAAPSTAVAQPMRLKLDSANHQYIWNEANTGSGNFMKVAAVTSAPQGLGAITFPLPLSLGGTPTIPMQVVTSTPTATPCTATNLGAVYWERAPTKTGCVEYRCTKTGTTLAWRCLK